MKCKGQRRTAALCLVVAALVLGGCGKAQASVPEKEPERKNTVETSVESAPVASGNSAEAAQSEPSAAEEDSHYLAQTERAVIDAINEERRALGLGELKYNESLTQASRVRSEELFRTKHWDHTRPNGDSWVTVLKEDVPTSFTAAGENLATISYNDETEHYESDASWWFTEWKNSPPHYENIIRPEFNEVGVGIYFAVRDDGMKVAYATTLFAEILPQE